MSKAVLLDESMDAAYCVTDHEGECVVRSAYQRNEVVQRWEKNGKIFIKVRPKTAEEAKTMREKIAGTLQKAIDEGRAVRDRIGRIRWIKH